MANKKTIKEFLEEIKEIVEVHGTEEQVEFLKERIEKVSKKRENTKPTAKQVENQALAERILENLAEINKPVTIRELQQKDETLAQFSVQRIAPILTKLVKEEKVIRTVDKKTIFFQIALA